MSANFAKTLMVLLLCLTFVGQAMAATMMSYQMTNMNGMSTPAQAHDMTMMAHSAHQMSADPQLSDTDKSAQDCCAKNCHCFIGGCSAVATIPKVTVLEAIVSSSPRILPLHSRVYTQCSSSLFRPPILS